ncbi:hypothetical protein LEMLEM_LOCUS25630, partial [Lemmus lemmus]
MLERRVGLRSSGLSVHQFLKMPSACQGWSEWSRPGRRGQGGAACLDSLQKAGKTRRKRG